MASLVSCFFLKNPQMLDKLFGRGKRKPEIPPEPAISFGRYSDNNKPAAKASRWADADQLFKEKKYPESIDAFFDYLGDDQAQNVVYERNGSEGRFHFFQGSRVVRGNFDPETIRAEVTLARMPQPSVPVMRRLLEMNFNLYYSRFALDHDRLCMRFDSDLETAGPGKLYYGLKELSTRADKQDDLLLEDFSVLESADTGHMNEISDAEKTVKFDWLQKWINQVLETIRGLDADKYSGGIAYMLLSLIYRIDYLIAPEGRLLNELEKTGIIYFKKDEQPVPEKNRDMADSFRKILEIPREEVFRNLIRSRYTFSIVAPQQYKMIADSIHAANQNLVWYRDNGHPEIARQIAEYGISYCQYSYSLPRVVTEFYHVFMMVNYADYFRDLGFSTVYYEPVSGRFDSKAIIRDVLQIQDNWKEKFPLLDFRTQNLRFDSLVNFNLSFTNEVEFLNLESK